MSDEAPEEDLSSASKRMLTKTLRELEELLETGGKRTFRVKCDACGGMVAHEVQVADAETLIKASSMLSAVSGRLKVDDDETSGAATKLLRDRSELTDAALSEYIVRLKAELAAERVGGEVQAAPRSGESIASPLKPE